MKIHVEIDDSLTEPVVTIKAASNDPELGRIQQLLTAPANQTLACYQDATEHFIRLGDILFIETDGRNLQVHTADNIYTNKHSLHELLGVLPGFFLQIAKSTVVNLNQVAAVNHSIANCSIGFHNSYKQVYASRRYYKLLLERLNEMRSLS
ncbi:LytTR family DNA-binding domain-containing protein [Lacticaseibacillus hulanensis]|uniref:LytTR family DNA-binding domain-containing protein n=1 Tax=Lacticaseibacillus hulanensis TaxID=2493111 RepID=UPI000FD983BC|nr:LytTR family DNA-binding domain-containing protein [Lacticaseibacillus hulanensis]